MANVSPNPRYAYPPGGLKFFRPASYSTFLHVVSRILPGEEGLPPADTAETARIADEMMSEKDATVLADFRKFFVAFEWLALFTHGRRFSRLSDEKKDVYLRLWEDSPIRKMRQGFWGAKALAFLGFYGREAAWPEMGYEGPAEVTPEGPRRRGIAPS